MVHPAAYARSTTSLTPSLPSSHDPEATLLHPLLGRSMTSMASEPVFPLLQSIRNDIIASIDTSLTYDQLKSPTILFSIVKPLLSSLSLPDPDAKDEGSNNARPPAPLIYALLMNRIQFLNEATDLSISSVSNTRADLCELLSIKLLASYGTGSSMEVLQVLTTNFDPFQGVSQDMFEEHEGVDGETMEELKEWGRGESKNAFELAVGSQAKRFVKSSLVQQVINAIYVGDITYQATGSHSLIADDYKSKPVVEIYDWRKQPFLDHYRLRVPMVRNRLEFITFASILGLFLLTQSARDDEKVTLWEGLFIAWSLGFALDEFAAIKENGLTSYLYGIYNILDSMFCLIFFTYLSLRLSALYTHDIARSELAFDILALAACILAPRLSIALIRGNVVLLALSAMIKEFVFFMGLASLTASGFLCAFYVLARGTWDVPRIAWLMFKIWLGNSYLGFEAAQQFHPVLGPILIVIYAVLSQTLLLTILISLLSNTFASVQANAETEILNQKALRTLERVKKDAMSCYTPPMNLIAFFLLLPLRFLASPRWFHKTHIFLVKLFNLPTLLFLALHTRLYHRTNFNETVVRLEKKGKEVWKVFPLWEGSGDIGRVFERRVKGGERVRIEDTTKTTTTKVEGVKPTTLVKPHPSPSSTPQIMTESMINRLDSIEKALAILVGEVVRNSEGIGGSTSAGPLTSLSGGREEGRDDD